MQKKSRIGKTVLKKKKKGKRPTLPDVKKVMRTV